MLSSHSPFRGHARAQNWEKAARQIAAVANGPKIVVEKSTLPVRTAEALVSE